MSGKFTLGHRRSAKLAPDQVKEIRRLYAEERWTQGRLARTFEVSIGQIGRIVRGESWQSYTQIPTEEELEERALTAPPPSPEQLASDAEWLAKLTGDTPERARQPSPEEHAQTIKEMYERLIRTCTCGAIRRPGFPYTDESRITHWADRPCEDKSLEAVASLERLAKAQEALAAKPSEPAPAEPTPPLSERPRFDPLAGKPDMLAKFRKPKVDDDKGDSQP